MLPCVREAEKINMSKDTLNHEYLGIAGDPNFVKLALEFAYGEDSDVLKEGRVAGVQTLSGTGGLRVMGELLKKGGHKEIYVVSSLSYFFQLLYREADLIFFSTTFVTES